MLRLLAREYETELSLLRTLLGESVQKVAMMTVDAVKPPNGPAMSALARTELIAAARTSPSVRQSRLQIREAGTAWVRVKLDGAVVQPRLRMRPPTAKQVEPSLFDGNVLRGPAGSIVLLWDWDGFGSLHSLTLSRVRSLRRWGLSCDILEEIKIAGTMADTVENPLRGGVPLGSRNEDDDLSGVVGVWDNEEDIRSEREVSDTRNEDVRDDEEGNSALGG